MFMDLESFSPLLLLLFWVLVGLFSSKKHKKKGQKLPPYKQQNQEKQHGQPKTLKEMLEPFITEITESPKKTIQNNIPSPPIKNSPPQSFEQSGKNMHKQVSKEPTSQKKSLIDASSTLTKEGTPALNSTQPTSGLSPAHASISKPMSAAPTLSSIPTREKLRTAVVWSEILAPPVSLRDETAY